MLGKGSYALVREAIHQETSHKVAIKVYEKYRLNKNNSITKCVIREIQILSNMMKSLEHYPENVMKLYDAIDK